MRMIPASLSASLRRRDLRPHHLGYRAGRRRRAARLASLRARAAPRGPAREAAAAPARRRPEPATEARVDWLRSSGARGTNRLGAGGDGRPGDCRPRRGRVLAGGLASGRPSRLGRVCRGRAGALRRGLAARPRRASTRARALVSAAPRRSEPRPARQSDAGHPPVGRARMLLRARRPDAAAEPGGRVGHRRPAGQRGSLPHRHPARSGRAASGRCSTAGRRVDTRRGSSPRCGRGSPASAVATSTSKAMRTCAAEARSPASTR